MRQAKTLSEKDFDHVLLAAAQGPHPERNQLILKLSYYAGLRVKEIAWLKMGDVVDSGGDVRDIAILQASQTKGQKGRRIVLNSTLRRNLENYLADLDKIFKSPEKPLIASQKGAHFNPNALSQLFSRLYRAAGIDGATSHSGRRTFLTNLSNKGVHARVLMELAGHKHLATTQRYLDVNDGILINSAELLQ